MWGPRDGSHRLAARRIFVSSRSNPRRACFPHKKSRASDARTRWRWLDTPPSFLRGPSCRSNPHSFALQFSLPVSRLRRRSCFYPSCLWPPFSSHHARSENFQTVPAAPLFSLWLCRQRDCPFLHRLFAFCNKNFRLQNQCLNILQPRPVMERGGSWFRPGPLWHLLFSFPSFLFVHLFSRRPLLLRLPDFREQKGSGYLWKAESNRFSSDSDMQSGIRCCWTKV